jgi:hypothetical protein
MAAELSQGYGAWHFKNYEFLHGENTPPSSPQPQPQAPPLRPSPVQRAPCGVSKLASCLQIGDFSQCAPNFGTPQACDVPAPYVVYWKIKNTREEATRVNQLRGEIVEDAGSHQRSETTKYRGSHYVECYIVKDRRVAAVDRQPVFVV